MRILLVSSSSGSRGGGEIFLLYLGEALRAAGHTVGLWTSRHPRMDELARRFASIGDVLRVEYRNTYDYWHRGVLASSAKKKSPRITASWLGWRPDVIHLNKQNLEDGLDLLAAANTLALPHLCTVHITQSARFLGARFAAWRDAAARRALRDYRGLLVVTAPVRATELQSFLADAREREIPTVTNGVPLQNASASDRAELRARENLPRDSFAVVALGRLEPQKQPLRFLDYAARIRSACPAAKFRWIGSGRMTEEWEQSIARKKLRDVVQRIDWRDDARASLSAYDLFLHPAAYEGFSFAILEAMDAGVPCAMEAPVHAQLPAALREASLVVNDATDWAILIRDRTRLTELAGRAQRIVREHYSTAAMAAAYVQLYEKLCRQG